MCKRKPRERLSSTNLKHATPSYVNAACDSTAPRDRRRCSMQHGHLQFSTRSTARLALPERVGERECSVQRCTMILEPRSERAT